MTHKEKQLQGLVRHEAKGLRRHLTAKEKENLDFDTLQPSSKLRCIYGQISGNCMNERAQELIVKCASRVFPSGTLNSLDFGGKLKDVNGAPKQGNRYNYWSPIETFIYRNKDIKKEQNSKKLIEYIKGNTNELNFE